MRTRNIFASLAALAVVLGLAGVILALHAGASGTRAAGVTATTPPDAVHVVVTFSQGYTTVPDPNNPNCPANSTCIKEVMTPTSSTPYDHTFTDAVTVQRLQADLNAPATAGVFLPGTSGRCGSQLATYDFTFTAGGQKVEHVVMRVDCVAFGVRTGYTPDLTLGAEQGRNGASLIDVLNTTYSHIPHDGGSNLTLQHPPQTMPAATAQP